MKILICGPTGSGKTTLARELAPMVGGVVFDGDAVRSTYPNPLGFSHHDRILHAAHVSALCDAVTASGNIAIAAIIAPTHATRSAFNPDLLICCEDLGDERYGDKAMAMEWPKDARLYCHKGHKPRYWAEIIANMVRPVFTPYYHTALFVGRYQPFHAGHKALIEEGIRRHGQACIGVRDTDHHWPFERVKGLIDAAMREHVGKYSVVSLPNIVAVCYGRDVGYAIEKIDLPEHIQAISGTALRAQAFAADVKRDLGTLTKT